LPGFRPPPRRGFPGGANSRAGSRSGSLIGYRFLIAAERADQSEPPSGTVN
jgi:hypothetical protein